MMNKYKIQIDLTTDRKLSDDELNNLHYALELQVSEPVNLDGEDESWDSLYSSINVERVENYSLSELAEALASRLGEGVTVSHEYPNYVRIVGLAEGVSVSVGFNDEGDSIEWQTNGGACNDSNDVIWACLSISEIVDALSVQWVRYGVDER
jgi:hypothetical protein